MISLILAVALTGQITANDGPPRSWQAATVDGKAVWLWGWKENGWVKFHKAENAQVFNPPNPVAKPAVKPPVVLGAGMVLEAGGTINNGLQLKQTHPTGVIDTNDRNLFDKIDRPLIKDRCPDEPEPDPLDPDATPKQELPWGWIVAGGLVFLLLLMDRKE